MNDVKHEQKILSKMDQMKLVWAEANAELLVRPGFGKLASGEITIEGYKEILRQIFHHARENPQIQALATVYFRGAQREQIKMFYKHAIAEIGHDQLALNDLKNLGEDVSKVPFENPLPETTALLAYPFFQIQHRNPVGYLGYLFFLEYTPVQSGARYIEILKSKGVPDHALEFLKEHATVDVAHLKLMETYVEKLIETEQDLSEVRYAIRTTAMLYGNMLEAAIKNAGAKRRMGTSEREIRRAA